MYTDNDYGGLIDYWAARGGDRAALVDGGRRWGYGELAEEVARFRAFLLDQGVGRGDAVVTVLRNGADFLALFFAALQIGCAVVPCDTAVDAELLRVRASACRARLAVVGGEAEASLACKAGLSCAVALTDLDAGRLFVVSDAREPAATAGCVPEGVFLVAFTSGSTSVPKGACLEASSLFVCGGDLARRLGLSREDAVLVPLPWSHMFGLTAGMVATLLAGACIVSMRKHDPVEALRLIEANRVTVHHGVPTMFLKELAALKEMGGDPPDLSSLRTGIAAGSFVSCVLVERMEREMGLKLASAYGSTEVVSVSMNLPSDALERRKETVGRPFEDVELRVVDVDGAALPTGAVGELQVRGPGVMKGYVGQPGETASVLSPDGWFSTGDLASVDEEGYLRILGRKKDLVIRGGNNVAPPALECVYLGHPDIEDVAVMGYPDEVFGEKIVCFVVPRPGAALGVEEVRSYACGRAPKFSVPDEVVFKDAFPRLSSGKTDKKRLKAEFLAAKGISEAPSPEGGGRPT